MDDTLYKEELMDIYKNPSHKGNLSNPTISVHKENSMCGDELTLELDIREGVVRDAKFKGSACAVSVISSEVLLEDLIGKTVEQAESITKEYLLDLLDMNLTTSRVKCATLVLTALKDGLKKYEGRKEENKRSVSKEDNLAAVIDQHPDVEEVLYDYGLHCVGCALNAFDSIEAGAKVHGLEDAEIDEMIDRINEVITVGE